jgi:RNA polymerase sigma-70 factor (ECF subfamily)
VNAQATRAALAQLSPQHRAVLTLKYLDGLPVSDIAALLDRSAAGVEALLTRAKSSFRENYQQEDGS